MTEPVAHAAEHGSKVSLSLLTKKIGPLPAYAYVLIIVGAAYAYRIYKTRSGAVATSAGALPSDASSVIGGTGAGGVSSGSVPADGPSGTVVGKTNAEWAATVSTGMVATGSNPVTVSSAVTKYLAGGLLTTQEAAIITSAVAKFGWPPEGVLPIKTVPPPGPVTPGKPPVKVVHQPPPLLKPPAPKPASHTYTVHSGDTLWSIAAHFYGNGERYPKIATANHIGPPYTIHPGQVLTIPA